MTVTSEPKNITDTADTAAVRTGAASHSAPVRFLFDTLTMTKRNVLNLYRQPQVLMFALITPIMFVSLFNFVFGNVIQTDLFGPTYAGLDYIDILIPGIMVQTVMFGGGNTAIGLAEDLSQGVIDRFRSLPMSRLAVLSGRTAADALRGVITNAVILLIGVALGFRLHNGIAWGFAAFCLVLFFGYSITWFYGWMGLKIKRVEAVQAATFLPAFPLTFAASTFSPVGQMPGWLQTFSANQPVTAVIDTVRAMMHGGEIANPLMRSLAWCVGITVFFATLSVREYRKG